MRAADKVVKVYALNGTYVVTGTAAGTLLIIYRCEVINDLNSAFGTGFLTLSAGDTAVLTYLAHLSALVVAVTLNDDLRGIVYEVNYAVGTLLNA